MLPVITVDDEKCTSINCRKCLVACPMRVLGLGTNVPPEKFKETEPDHFIVRGVRFLYCTACMECVKVCPNDAIQVTFNGR